MPVAGSGSRLPTDLRLSTSQDQLCYCHFGETVAAEVVAARLRRLSGRSDSLATFACGYAIAGALLAGTVLLSAAI